MRTFDRDESVSSLGSADEEPLQDIEGMQPSKNTMDRSLAAKMYIEQYYTNIIQQAKERGDRYVKETHSFQHIIKYYLLNTKK